MGAPLRAPISIDLESAAALDADVPFAPTVPDMRAPPSPATMPAEAAPDAEAPDEISFQVRSKVLERLARGAPLDEILELLAREIERNDVTVQVSILLLRDGDGAARLHAACAPSLPHEYSLALEGTPIGPNTGSCGSAAYWGERVIVSNIAADPLWRDYRELALRHGLRACWSQPINASNGQVLGTLAMYYRSVREPREAELHAMVEAANLASIAIERKHTDERIARLTSLYRARSEIGHYIAQTLGEAELLAAMCRVAVDFGGMRMAWIGRPDAGTLRIKPLLRISSIVRTANMPSPASFIWISVPSWSRTVTHSGSLRRIDSRKSFFSSRAWAARLGSLVSLTMRTM